MTLTRCGLRTFTIAAAFALAAAAASGQTAPAPPAHDHGNRPHAAPQVNVPARMALLDERIAMLVADMKMFAGDMKIQTMSALLEALVERQSLADRQMRSMHERMHDGMRDQMEDRSTPVPPLEMEPEAMCSPFI